MRAMMLSMGQATRILGVTPITARRWAEAGLLPCVRTPGGHRRVAREDVIELSRAVGGSSRATVRKARERELETLVEASIAVAGQLEQEALLVEIAKHVIRLCRCHSCTIGSYPPEEGTVTIIAEYDSSDSTKGIPGVYDLREFPATLAVLAEQAPKVVNVNDPRADPAERADLRRWGDMSNLMLPLVFRGRSIGLLEAVDWERERTYSRQEIRLVGALAGHAAVALHNAELYRAADSVDAAMRGLHELVRNVSAQVLRASESSDAVEPFAAIATVIRDSFAALSFMVALDDAVVAATTAPPGDATLGPRGGEARALTSGADTSHGRLSITVVMPTAATDGESDLLEMVAAFVALLSTLADASVGV